MLKLHCIVVFLNILKMASPFVPHISEEMYHSDVVDNKLTDSITDSGYFYKNEKIKSVHNNSRWPVDESKRISTDIIRGADLTLFVIAEVRKFKTQRNMKLGTEVMNINIFCPKTDHATLQPFLKDVVSVTRTKNIELRMGDELGVEVEMCHCMVNMSLASRPM